MLYFYVIFLGVITVSIITFVFKKSKFSKYGVKCLQRYPFFGNGFQLFSQTRHISDILQDSYNQFFKQRFIGFYYFGSPIIILKDLNLIKRICVDEFQSFPDHQGNVDEKIDPVFGNNLFSSRGQKWHDMRSTLRQVFTSFALSEILLLVETCADRMIEFLGENEKEIEAKELFGLFTNDVIGSVAFGETINSFCAVNNDFLQMVKQTILQTKLKPEHTKMQILKQVITTNFPTVMKYFRGPVLSPEVSKYFRSIVLSNLGKRRNGFSRRNDLVQLMADVRYIDNETNFQEFSDDSGELDRPRKFVKGKRDWNDDELTAQAVIFLISGYETTATFLSFLVYELATHPEVQQRLQDEIDINPNILNDGNRKLDYVILNDMKYLKMVVAEALRLWPPVIITDRRCAKKCDIGLASKSSAKSYTVEVNESIWIPIFSIHRDPRYFENPLTFDPERFSEERIKDIQPHSYMPFGIGARSCIAVKFALLEAKVAIVKILKNYNIATTQNTQIPLKMKSTSLNMLSERGIWVTFVPKKK